MEEIDAMEVETERGYRRTHTAEEEDSDGWSEDRQPLDMGVNKDEMKIRGSQFLIVPRVRRYRTGRGEDTLEQFAEVYVELVYECGTRRWVARPISGMLLWSRRDGSAGERWYDWEGREVPYARSAARGVGVSEGGEVLSCSDERVVNTQGRFCGTRKSWSRAAEAKYTQGLC